jgi:cell division initiation protein
MDVTAQDVEQARFPTTRKGYDPDVVDQFLDRVAATLRNMEGRLRDLLARTQALEEQLNEQRESEVIMRRTLQVAQRTADETVAEAQARARQIVEEAQARANELQRRAEERAREIDAQLRKQIDLAGAEVEALRQYFHDFREKAARLVNEFAAQLSKAEMLAEEKPRVELPSQQTQLPSGATRPSTGGPTVGAPSATEPTAGPPTTGGPPVSLPPSAGPAVAPPPGVATSPQQTAALQQERPTRGGPGTEVGSVEPGSPVPPSPTIAAPPPVSEKAQAGGISTPGTSPELDQGPRHEPPPPPQPRVAAPRETGGTTAPRETGGTTATRIIEPMEEGGTDASSMRPATAPRIPEE